MRCCRGLGLLVVLALLGAGPAGLAVEGDEALPRSADPAALLSIRAARWHPAYDPSVNYCGPEWLQESGWGWLVPRDPVSGFDFSPACYDHDACYSECCQNGRSQADCDEDFLIDMEDICSDTRDALLAGCSGWSYVGCVVATLARYVLCTEMAATYAGAVSYLGDGVVETEPLALLLAPLGPAAVAAAVGVAMLAGDLQIEAAYQCPCRCLECPPDEPLGPPCCEETASGAVVAREVIRYEHGEETNVSGEGVVCECVAGREVITRECPAGSTCAPGGEVCAGDLCDPATCEHEEIVGRCEQHGLSFLGLEVSFYGVLTFALESSACGSVDEYVAECVTTTEELLSVYCPTGCAPDGLSCLIQQLHPLPLRVMEPTSRAADTFVPCGACRVRVEGVGGTFEGTTAIDGTVTLPQVPTGVYVVRYGCGPDALGSHRPSDLVLHPAEPVSWVPADDLDPSSSAALPTVLVPAGEPVDVLAGFCGPSATCSAGDLSDVPMGQDLPAAVEATRRQIIAAAVACDYHALAALATAGSIEFSYGSSGSADPAAHWQSLEASGGQPLRQMVATLNLPVTAAGVGGTGDAFYLWSDGAGGATEYRMGISAAGDWLFFLPDD